MGLDRRWLPHAAIVLGLFVLLVVVVPQIDHALAFDDPVRAGETMALTDGVVFTPATGWNVEQGHRVGAGGEVVKSGDVRLERSGISFTVTSGTFDGTPRELLAQVEKVTSLSGTESGFHTTTAVQTISTTSGLTGVAQGYLSSAARGTVAAFVIDGTGLKVQVVGPADGGAHAREIAAMLASVRAVEDSSDAGGTS